MVFMSNIVSTGFDPEALAASLRELDGSPVDARTKGVPSTALPVRVGDIFARKWNLLAGDLPAPVAIVRSQQLDENAIWMNRLLKRYNLLLAPHAKTTMCPHIFAHQAKHDCWGLTVATAQQASVAAHFGCRKIILANELVGQAQTETIISLLKIYGDLQIYVFVDSAACIGELAAQAGLKDVFHRCRLLLDVGFESGRTGCRNVTDALAVIAEARRCNMKLSGIGGYEGLIAATSGKEDPAGVERYFDMFSEIAQIAETSGAFADGEIVLTAGGSAYYDVVGKRLSQIALQRPILKILRSGCYATHDCGTYERHQNELLDRCPEVVTEVGKLVPSLFVCGRVQSRPEPRLALVTMGKRDAGSDADFPVPVWRYRKGFDAGPMPTPSEWNVFRMNDQHTYLRISEDDDVMVGDLVCFGISHPCTTFDRWRIIHLVDENWNSIALMPTFF